MLEVAGVTSELRKQGIKEGDTVAIGDVMEFDWSDNRSQRALYEAWDTQRTARKPHAG